MTKVILHGCNGHMGRVLTDIIANDPDMEVVAGVDKYLGLENSYPVFSSLFECDLAADAVIDFSNAAAIDDLLSFCEKKTMPVVLCTTGLSDEQLKKVEEAAKKTAVLRSANMSLGINAILDLLKKASQVFVPAGFDVEIL